MRRRKPSPLDVQGKEVVQRAEEHWTFAPGPETCANANFIPHMEEGRGAAEATGRPSHTIINITRQQLQEEITTYLHGVPEGEQLPDQFDMTTRRQYDYQRWNYETNQLIGEGHGQQVISIQLQNGTYAAYHYVGVPGD